MRNQYKQFGGSKPELFENCSKLQKSMQPEKNNTTDSLEFLKC